MRKVAHLQVAVVVKAVWGIFNTTNVLHLQVYTLLVIYKPGAIAFISKENTDFLSNIQYSMSVYLFMFL